MSAFSEKLQKYSTLTIAVIVGFANFLFLSAYNLHPDEALYWVWSRKLDIGYLDNAPGVAYFIRLFTTIGGNTEFWVRMTALIVWVLFLVFVYIIAKKAFQNEKAGWLGVLIAIFVPLVTGGSTIMTNDPPMIFFAIFTWYFLYQAIEEEKKTAWYWVGLFFGLAFFTKFQAILMVLAVFSMLLIRPRKRKILLWKEPYVAVLMGFIMFSPVLYWNWTHHWASFLYEFHHGVNQSINPGNIVTFLGGQLGTFSLLFLALIYYTVKRLIRWREIPSGSAFLIGCFLPVFLFFSLTSLTYTALVNWPAIVYLPAIIFLAGELSLSLGNLTVIKRRFLMAFLGCSFAVSLLLVGLVRYPGFFIHKLGWKLSPNVVLTNDMYGWNQLGKQVDSLVEQQFPGETRPVPIFGNKYQTAAELEFYVSKPAVIFTTRQAHRNYFDYRLVDQIKAFDGRAGLLVLESEVPANAAWYFQGIKPVEEFSISRFSQPIRHLYIYRFTKLNAKALFEMAKNKPLGYPGSYPD